MPFQLELFHFKLVPCQKFPTTKDIYHLATDICGEHANRMVITHQFGTTLKKSC